MPKKPDRPFSSLDFATDGQVELRVEHTDLEKEDLERRMAERFAAAVRDRTGRNLSVAEDKPEEPADVFLMEGGTRVFLQIAEVVDQDIRRHDAFRDLVERELRRMEGWARLAEMGNVGVAVTRAPPDSEQKSCTSKLISAARELATIGERVRLQEQDVDWEIRLLPKAPEVVGAVVRLNDGAPGGNENWLRKTVEGKLKKNYAKPSGPFWLVCYSRDVVLRPDHGYFRLTAKYLESTPHPFDEVWWMFPFPDLGADVHQLSPDPQLPPEQVEAGPIIMLRAIDARKG